MNLNTVTALRRPQSANEVLEWRDGFALQNRSQRILGGDIGLRKKVLAALYPTFAKEIEHGFRTMEGLPYTTGYNRRPYRAPKRPEFFAAKIGAYLDSVNDALGEIADDALTPEWVASWAVHLHYETSGLGYLFAGQIDAGRNDVLEILKDSAANRHAIGGPGKHAVLVVEHHEIDHAEQTAGIPQFLRAHIGKSVSLIVLAVRHAQQRHLSTTMRAPGQQSPARQRLVVGMREYGEQRTPVQILQPGRHVRPFAPRGGARR